MREAERARTAADLAADPRRLDRDDLIALVERLQALADRQQATIAEQAAELAGRRPNGVGNGQAAPSRPAAKPVAGCDYTIVFDGGSLGNPGKGYGSFQIVDRNGVVAAEQLEFGDGVTNNQAEFRTLIRALEALRERIGAAGSAGVAVRGDSQLVINTVNGSWKARHPELIPLRDRAVALLREFSRSDVAWQRRSASVRVLGH